MKNREVPNSHKNVITYDQMSKQCSILDVTVTGNRYSGTNVKNGAWTDI